MKETLSYIQVNRVHPYLFLVVPVEGPDSCCHDHIGSLQFWPQKTCGMWYGERKWKAALV
jgi:hypothetical protein